MATIEEDFEYELGRINMGPDNIYNVGFEVKELLINNNELKQTLFHEFSLLKPKPKLKLYLNHFVSDEVYWNARKNLGCGSQCMMVAFVFVSIAKHDVDTG